MTQTTRQGLNTLAISFGQGLQMTNIIKDFWPTKKEVAGSLSLFLNPRVSLDKIDLENIENFKKGIDQIVSVAHHHLVNAFKYTTLIPKKKRELDYSVCGPSSWQRLLYLK